MRPIGPEVERALLFLRDQGTIEESSVERVRRVLQQESGRFVEAIIALGLVPEDVLADQIARAFDLPRLSEQVAQTCVIDATAVTQRFQEGSRIAVARDSDGGLWVATSDPTATEVLTAVAFATGSRARPVVATDAEIQKLHQQQEPNSTSDDARQQVGSEDASTDIERLRESASDAPIIRLVNDIIANAVDAGASDIHFEPGEGRLLVRYRIDGVLRDMHRLSLTMLAAIISRVKIMASLDIGERRLPQDGAITAHVRGRQVDLRVATAPAVRGETAVVRILNRARVELDMAKLGFQPGLVDQLAALLARPNGIFLVTGPTGSGKSTTLYAALQHMNTGAAKILTVEDPVEFRLSGVNQIQAKPDIGLTFAHALRSMLRHDPDIIMIGEIRDPETAQIAVQAALTGHLVLASLHTNSAAASIVRLLDMGVDDYLIASTLNGVLAQRLVRKLCGSCRAQESDGRWSAPGCSACSGSGYAGRAPVAELLTVSEAQRRLIVRDADVAGFERQAIMDGMVPIGDDALRRAQDGVTSLAEARRITHLGE